MVEAGRKQGTEELFNPKNKQVERKWAEIKVRQVKMAKQVRTVKAVLISQWKLKPFKPFEPVAHHLNQQEVDSI